MVNERTRSVGRSGGWHWRVSQEAQERAADIKKESDSEANARKLDRERVMKYALAHATPPHSHSPPTPMRWH